MNLSAALADLQDVPASLLDDAIVDSFMAAVERSGLSLYPAQEEALLELVSGSNVILATPTGSGKSLVATAAHFTAMAKAQKSFYTAPIKALVNEKFFSLCDTFGAENVGMMTGDAAVNTQAPIICATAEIVANIALREGSTSGIKQIVMDEFHYYADPDRGWAWQIPLLELPQAQFLLMSATLGNIEALREDLSSRTGNPTALITHSSRPVPLSYEYVVDPIHDTINSLIDEQKSPIYIVHFTQKDALDQAQALTSLPLATREHKQKIAQEIGDFRFTTTFGHTLSRLLKQGIGVHHAGMLPKYRRLVERLAQVGLLKVISGTDTLGVGINVPIRTVLFTGLSKFDGHRQRHLKAREFHQISGRAGRAGFDTEGFVVIEAPEHEIQNARQAQKRSANPKKKRSPKKKAPEGRVSWSKSTFDRLVAADPEPLRSQFSVSNSMLLNVLSRPGNCFFAMEHLLRTNHSTRAQQNRQILHAIELYRGLINAGIVEQLDSPTPEGRRARLTEELQENFALNQPLSAFAVAAMDVLDKDSPTYALDLVSIVEAILDDPRPLLFAQQRAARGEEIAKLKADGVDYEERMALVEDITWPQPLLELLETVFESYRHTQPWVSDFQLSPKSVVREMLERAMTFADLTSAYGVARSEGVLLRYLTDAYRTLKFTVPSEAKTEEVEDIIEWLGELIRRVDSSLLDEWEQLSSPEIALQPASDDMVAQMKALGTEGSQLATITSNPRAFRVMVRNALFRHIELLSRDNISGLTALDEEIAEVFPDWDKAIDPYWDDYDAIGTGSSAHGPQLFSVRSSGEGVEAGNWEARQTLEDPEGDHGWAIVASVNLNSSDLAGDVRFDEINLVSG